MHAIFRVGWDAKECTFIRSPQHLNDIQLMYLWRIIPINCECRKTFHKKIFFFFFFLFFSQFAGNQHMDSSFPPTAASIQLRPGPFVQFFSISCHFAAVYPLKAKMPQNNVYNIIYRSTFFFFEEPKII